MIRSEFTDLPPGKFIPRLPLVLVVDSVSSAPTVTPTDSEVTFSDSGTPSIINVAFTADWVAI